MLQCLQFGCLQDVKVVQLLLILKEIEAFLKQENSMDIPMLIMGDFNSEHDSGVYELLSKGKVRLRWLMLQWYNS